MRMNDFDDAMGGGDLEGDMGVVKPRLTGMERIVVVRFEWTSTMRREDEDARRELLGLVN